MLCQIACDPSGIALRNNRSLALLKRCWLSDFPCALRDIDVVLRALQSVVMVLFKSHINTDLDPRNEKALSRKLDLLVRMQRRTDAVAHYEAHKAHIPVLESTLKCIEIVSAQHVHHSRQFSWWCLGTPMAGRAGNRRQRLEHQRRHTRRAAHGALLGTRQSQYDAVILCSTNLTTRMLQRRTSRRPISSEQTSASLSRAATTDACTYGTGTRAISPCAAKQMPTYSTASRCVTRYRRHNTPLHPPLQPHPSELLLATSGIEDVVKLWRPVDPDYVATEFQEEELADLEALFGQVCRAHSNHQSVSFHHVTSLQHNSGGEDNEFTPLHHRVLQVSLSLLHGCFRSSHTGPCPAGLSLQLTLLFGSFKFLRQKMRKFSFTSTGPHVAHQVGCVVHVRVCGVIIFGTWEK